MKWLDALLQPFREMIDREDHSFILPKLRELTKERKNLEAADARKKQLDLVREIPENKERSEQKWIEFHKNEIEIKHSNEHRNSLLKRIGLPAAIFDDMTISAFNIIVQLGPQAEEEQIAIYTFRESLERVMNILRFDDYTWHRESDSETKCDWSRSDHWDPTKSFVERTEEELRDDKRRFEWNKFVKDYALKILLQGSPPREYVYSDESSHLVPADGKGSPTVDKRAREDAIKAGKKREVPIFPAPIVVSAVDRAAAAELMQAWDLEASSPNWPRISGGKYRKRPRQKQIVETAVLADVPRLRNIWKDNFPPKVGKCFPSHESIRLDKNGTGIRVFSDDLRLEMSKTDRDKFTVVRLEDMPALPEEDLMIAMKTHTTHLACLLMVVEDLAKDITFLSRLVLRKSKITHQYCQKMMLEKLTRITRSFRTNWPR
jgi:hypothetical protein